MKPAPFEYIAPDSVDSTLVALQENGFGAKLLAGGQSLVPVMNFRLAQPSVLIDLNPLTELNFIRYDAATNELHLGAMVRQRQIEQSQLVAEHAPLMYETMPYIAHPQIRNRGTLGGSLAHADPAGELPMIAVTLNGRIRLQKTTGERWVSAPDFFTSLFETACEDDEMVTEVALPAMPKRTGYAFQELARRHGDYALAGVAALVTVDSSGICTAARLVYLNLGEMPMVAHKAAGMLVGNGFSEALVTETAVTASQEEIDPTGDIHATTEYKRHLAKVLTERVLRQAFEKTKNN